MNNTASNENGGETLRTLLIVVAIAFTFLAWGFFIFFAVGDKGPPGWSFGVVQDIPGESPYSTDTPTDYLLPVPGHKNQTLVQPQHVRELPSEPGAPQEKGAP
jgi:hypothetical protein